MTGDIDELGIGELTEIARAVTKVFNSGVLTPQDNPSSSLSHLSHFEGGTVSPATWQGRPGIREFYGDCATLG